MDSQCIELYITAYIATWHCLELGTNKFLCAQVRKREGGGDDHNTFPSPTHTNRTKTHETHETHSATHPLHTQATAAIRGPGGYTHTPGYECRSECSA